VRFRGKTALITGAGSGIGVALAEGFHAEGANVLAVDIDLAAAERTIAGLGGGEAMEADVADPVAVKALVERVGERIGAVDVLCNNAGIFDDYKPAHETEVEVWDRVMAVNLRGPFLVSAALVPAMIEAGGGAIINTASIAGVGAAAGGAAYTASKHGLLGLTRQMAFDYGRYGIRVNAICPGVVATPMSERTQQGDSRPAREGAGAAADKHVDRMVAMTPAGRWANPQEMASVVTFLASSEASFLHGATVLADGGWTLI
jgi:3-oxoacyl-[acyl-carrier protein] reductase